MRRRFFSNTQRIQSIIYYTSTDGGVVHPAYNGFNVSVINNYYQDGIGHIIFNGILKLINDNAFYSCSSLTSIQIPNSVTSIGDWTFYNCSSLTSIQIPNSVTSIGDMAFIECSSLTSIQIPNSVTSIGSNVFAWCSSLTSIEIPDSVAWIGPSAFYGCTSLTSIEIPDSVTSIGDRAFGGCNRLKSVYIKSTIPPILGSSVFDSNASNRKIYVPRASLNAYKTASGWSDYAYAIEPYDFDGGGE